MAAGQKCLQGSVTFEGGKDCLETDWEGTVSVSDPGQRTQGCQFPCLPRAWPSASGYQCFRAQCTHGGFAEVKCSSRCAGRCIQDAVCVPRRCGSGTGKDTCFPWLSPAYISHAWSACCTKVKTGMDRFRVRDLFLSHTWTGLE